MPALFHLPVVVPVADYMDVRSRHRFYPLLGAVTARHNSRCADRFWPLSLGHQLGSCQFRLKIASDIAREPVQRVSPRALDHWPKTPDVDERLNVSRAPSGHAVAHRCAHRNPPNLVPATEPRPRSHNTTMRQQKRGVNQRVHPHYRGSGSRMSTGASSHTQTRPTNRQSDNAVRRTGPRPRSSREQSSHLTRRDPLARAATTYTHRVGRSLCLRTCVRIARRVRRHRR